MQRCGGVVVTLLAFCIRRNAIKWRNGGNNRALTLSLTLNLTINNYFRHCAICIAPNTDSRSHFILRIMKSLAALNSKNRAWWYPAVATNLDTEVQPATSLVATCFS